MIVKYIRAFLFIVVLVYAISPIVFKHSKFIQRNLLFMNHVNTHYYFNLSQPEGLGIKCSRTLRLDNKLDTSDNIQLGVWHIVPESSIHSCTTDHDSNRTYIDDKSAFSGDQRPIVLYFHGNGGNRGGRHRGLLYQRLAYEFDYHVVTFDYRGYGDSTYVNPSVPGLNLDARFMYEWLLSQPNVNKDRLIVWGHSLGTAVATALVASLPGHMEPKRLVLEAPFDSLANAIANHPFSIPFRVLPYFEQHFVEPIEKSPEFNYNSLKVIGKIESTPVMILHAEDDGIIPFQLGRNLYEQAVKDLGKLRVRFVPVRADLGLGHKFICKYDEAMSTARRFIDSN